MVAACIPPIATAYIPKIKISHSLKKTSIPDEYKAVARRIAGDLGIDFFDDSTYEPHRLMYWPSTSKDGGNLSLNTWMKGGPTQMKFWPDTLIGRTLPTGQKALELKQSGKEKLKNRETQGKS